MRLISCPWRSPRTHKPVTGYQMGLNLERDGVEIHEAVLTDDDIRLVRSDISLGSQFLRRGGIRNLEKKFASIAKLAG